MTAHEHRGDPVQRAVDLVLAIPALVVAAPLIAAAAAATAATSGRPAFFRQERAGLQGEPFTLLKVRTMRTPEQVGTTDDGARLTSLGRRLRSWSLDELPQLWNVIRGDMSLVGPRPLPVVYVPRYTPLQRRRLEVRPGITGLAQVTGRNLLTWDERFALDVRYVETRTLWLDLWLLIKTVGQVVRREGVTAEGHTTMPEFVGARVDLA